MKLQISPVVIWGVLSAIVVMICTWRILRWAWLKPKKLERCLRQQGLSGNPYRLLIGDLKQLSSMAVQATSKPINLNQDIVPRVYPLSNYLLNTYGKDCFMWIGPVPRVIIMKPDHIKEVFLKINDFRRITTNPLFNFLVTGLLVHDDEKWATHRRIINQAFLLDKLKRMVPAFCQSCSNMVSKWEELVSVSDEEWCELDVWPHLVNLTCDVISRTAFGSSFQEGKRIFQLQDELLNLIIPAVRKMYIRGWRFVPTKLNKRIKKINKEIQVSLQEIINKREKAMKAGNAANDDLLGILMESNSREIEEHGNKKNAGMSMRDVIDECRLFYFAGQETTSVLLVWSMVLLAQHTNWQSRAREEVLRVFGNDKLDFDRLSHLKVITMILYEVLRLYPPVPGLGRVVNKEMRVGKLLIPAGVEVFLPIIQIHRDHELWGDDATEFKPERFIEGVSKATKNKVCFFPFGWGARICIGQNFAIIEAKMALAMIVRRFMFELSPSYSHAPYSLLTMHPQHGAHMIIRKL